MTTSARIVLISCLIVSSCGGAEEPAPQQTPAQQEPAIPAPEMPAAPPTTVGPVATPPPKPVAPKAAAPTQPSARPAYTRTDLQTGTGAQAQKGRNLTVHYTGWLYDHTKPDMKGRMFDS